MSQRSGRRKKSQEPDTDEEIQVIPVLRKSARIASKTGETPVKTPRQSSNDSTAMTPTRSTRRVTRSSSVLSNEAPSETPQTARAVGQIATIPEEPDTDDNAEIIPVLRKSARVATNICETPVKLSRQSTANSSDSKTTPSRITRSVARASSILPNEAHVEVRAETPINLPESPIPAMKSPKKEHKEKQEVRQEAKDAQKEAVEEEGKNTELTDDEERKEEEEEAAVEDASEEDDEVEKGEVKEATAEEDAAVVGESDEEEDDDEIDGEDEESEDEENKDGEDEEENEDDDHLEYSHSLRSVFKNPTDVVAALSQQLERMYKWGMDNGSARPDSLPSTLLTTDAETTWQQIQYRNEQLTREIRRAKKGGLLDAAILLDGPEESEQESDEDMEEDGVMFDDVDMEEMEEETDTKTKKKQKKEKGIFDIDDEDLKDIDAQLAAMAEESEEEREGRGKSSKLHGMDDEDEPQKREKKYRKSIVDDKFFSLARMEEYLEEMEKEGREEEELLVQEEGDGVANYRYNDFFEEKDGSGDKLRDEQKNKKKSIKTPEHDDRKKEKNVRFDVEQNVGEVDEQEEEDDGGMVLLGPVEDERESATPLKASISKIKKKIAELEDTNLEPRAWQLQGEATARDRDSNTLLESHFEFDQGAKRAPEVTEDFNAKIDAMILERIKNKAYDDPVRVIRREERTDEYRNQVVEEDLLVKKSLAEVYEKEYEKAQGEGGKDEKKENPAHVEINKIMTELYENIDALFHFGVTPKAVIPEVKVVTSVRALQAEEVGAMASTADMLVAPEEVKKREKGEVKAPQERTTTDKKRDRRKKKNRQRAVVEVMGDKAPKKRKNDEDKDGVAKKKKKADVATAAVPITTATKFKSTDFFTKLQQTVQNELTSKTTKASKQANAALKSSNSAKYKM